MIKVIIPTDRCLETWHPDMEVRNAVRNCDECSKHKNNEYVFYTVSPDAVGTYEYYGKEVLGLDVRLFLDDKQVSIEKAFQFFNKAFNTLTKFTGI